jgi:hypothetical protein
MLKGKFNNVDDMIKYFFNKIEQKDCALEYLKSKNLHLVNSVQNSKIFLNMVVHDMRNPTSQIEFIL